MIVDFHTHCFPDKIADRTIDYLQSMGKVKAHHKGTASALKASMNESGVDISVILPVATAAKQTDSINRLSAEQNGKDGLCYAGAVHPDCENIDKTLDYIKSAGLFGIKIHPDYQGTYFNDERYIHIMAEAAKRGLYIVTHAGIDIAYPDDVHCTPDMVLEVLERLKGLIDNKLILAHMGGCDLPDEVLSKLCGKHVYIDTAFVLDRYPDKCREIIEKHGAERILFATDSPWAGQRDYLNIMGKMGIPESDLEKIMYLNAFGILGINKE